MASSEVAHAGIGADITVNGLDSLVKANTELEKMRQFADELKRSMDGIRVRFEGTGELNDVVDKLRKVKDNVNTRVDLQVSGDGQLRQMMDNINQSAKTIRESVRSVTDDANRAREAVRGVGDSLHKDSLSSNEFKHSMAEQTDAIKSFESKFIEAMKKTDESTKKPLHGLSKLREQMHRIGSGIAGSAIGMWIANAASNAMSGAKGFIEQGVQLNQGGIATGNMWKQSGLDSKQVDAMSKEVAAIRGQANMAGSAIIGMQKSFLQLTGSAPQARKLTDVVAAFGKESNASSEEIANSSQKLLRVLNSNGKSGINKSMFDRLFKDMPALRSEIIKTSGMTTGQFDKMVASGKLTGNKLKEYMLEASKDSGKAWANYGKTFNGLMDSMKGTWTNAKAVFAKPFVNQLQKQLGSMDKHGKGLQTLQKDALALAKTLGAKVGNYMGEAINFLTKNAKPLGTILKSLLAIASAIGKGVWNTFAGILSMIGGHSRAASHGLDGVAGGLKAIASHRTALKAVGATLVTVFAVSKVTKFTSALGKAGQSFWTFTSSISGGGKKAWDAVKKFNELRKSEGLLAASQKGLAAAQKLLNAAMKDNPAGVVIVAITALVAIVVLLYKKCKPFRELCNGLAKWFMKAFGLIIKWAGKLLGSIGKMAKGVGKWFGNVWQDGKSNFSKLRSDVGKSFKGLSKDLDKTQKDTNKAQKAQLKVFGDIFHGRFGELKKDVPKLFSSMFEVLKDIGRAAFNYLNKLTGGRLGDILDKFKDIGSDISKAWDATWNGVAHFFEGIWNWIKKTAASGMNGVIGVMNDGIGAIDTVIHTFGGSSTAIGKISPVHFATGTGAFSGPRRPITSPTLAMLNDGNDSPATGNKEMILHPSGASELVHGRNTKRILEPGAEVLNARETAFMMSLQKGAFADGTGFLGEIGHAIATGIGKGWDGLKDFSASIAKKVKDLGKIIGHPMGFFESVFGNLAGINGQLMKEFTSGVYGKGKEAATGWWTELMRMAKAAENGSESSSELLNAVMKYGTGHRYVWGATGPDSFDCSGLVQYALHKLGIDYPRTSGAQIAHAQHISRSEARTGDLVGNGEHIGVVANDSATKYFSAFNPSSHPNILMTPLNSTYFPGTPQFGRVQGLHANNPKNSKGSNSALDKLIKSQTGGFLKWIAKNMQTDGGSFGNPAGDGVKRWIPLIKKAASAMNVSLSQGKLNQILEVMQGESGGDATVTQKVQDVNSASGHPAQGLFQFVPSTFANYAVKGHEQIKNGYDQILAMFNDSSWESDLTTHGWGPTGSRRRAMGGPTRKGETYLVGEEGPELFTPLEDGKIISHGQSKRMISQMNRNSSVKYQPIINIQGNPDDATIAKMSRVLEKHGDSLMDMLVDGMGFNDEGGLII